MARSSMASFSFAAAADATLYVRVNYTLGLMSEISSVIGMYSYNSI